MKDHIMQLSMEQCIELGYVIVRIQGSTRSYLPTDRYRALFAPPTPPALLQTSDGEYLSDPEETYYLCGECGHAQHLCQCSSLCLGCGWDPNQCRCGEETYVECGPVPAPPTRVRLLTG